MNIHWFRLGGMILSIVICFLTTVYCQDQNWNGHYYQHYSPSSMWVAQNHNNRGGDLELQSSMNRPSSSFGKMPWKNPQSKPQWQSPMYKPKWQDLLSKPQWQLSKAHHMKPFMKRPFKNSNSLNKQPHDQWRAGPKEWQGRFRTKPNGIFFPQTTPQPRNWPDYIPPLSIIKPSMDDPHALYNFK